jgi:hypothetical protein
MRAAHAAVRGPDGAVEGVGATRPGRAG